MDGRNNGRGKTCGLHDETGLRSGGRRDLRVGALAARSQQLDGAPRDLVSSLGHELKTPLSIVLGLCGRLLAAGGLDAPRSDDVERIRANAYVLLKRVEELLQVARLDAGRLELEARPVDVAALVRQILDGFASVAELRDQRLELQAPAALEAEVDEEKLVSVVSNLVANALKHAPAGGSVRVRVGAVRQRLRLEVADDGPGVPAGLREEIFERFEQGPGTAARPGGSGLGLAIVRDLVGLHGGTVTLRDAREGGALFVVDLPLRRRTRGRRSPAPGPAPLVDVAERQRATVEELRAELRAVARRNGDGHAEAAARDVARVLVIAADDELGAYLGELLRPARCVEHAASALDGGRLLDANAYDVVLVDAEAGGHAVAALRRGGGCPPLLALAAATHDVAPLLQAGAADCVIKPFAQDELLARLDALVARARSDRGRGDLESALGHAFEAAAAPMALVTGEGEFVRVNRALCALLGLSPDELLARGARSLTHPDETADQATRHRELATGRLAADGGAWRLARGDGSWLRARIAASAVATGEPSDGLLLWRVRAEPQAGHATPGAAGRRGLERALRHQMLRCERYGEQASLVRCSLPDLPRVRAEHGPEVAERLVTRILDSVRSRLRDTDVVAQVGDHDLAALLAHADGDAAATVAAGVREAAERERVIAADARVGTRAAVEVVPVLGATVPPRFADAGLPPGTAAEATARPVPQLVS
jgi:PAS domain S-box-containing protein